MKKEKKVVKTYSINILQNGEYVTRLFVNADSFVTGVSSPYSDKYYTFYNDGDEVFNCFENFGVTYEVDFYE